MIEQAPILWFASFFIDVLLGSLCFYIIMAKPIRSGFDGLFWWFGWWAFVDAFAIVLNATMGVHYFWSYHQSGIVIDTAINSGLLLYVVKALRSNWALSRDDWAKIEQIAKDAKIRELSK